MARERGVSVSSLVNRIVDEAIRMEDHPGIFFRNGPAGRRAVLIGGPDVWEVIRAVKNVKAAQPDLDPDALLDAVEQGTGVPRSQISVAIGYWSAYPAEIDDWIAAADEEERAAYERWQRERDLLAS
jgi:hypothetical protein